MFKNTAGQKWMVYAYNVTTGVALTGDAANITAKIRQDYGTRNASNDTNPTELELGYYEFDLTQAETNGDALGIFPESTTGSIQVVGAPRTIFTYPSKHLSPELIALVEHSNPHTGSHTVQGNIYFVDPVNGDTHANGNRGGRYTPYLGVQDCHDNAIVDSNHDLIILLAGQADGVTTMDEFVTISKRYLMIRGPGRDFIWTRGTNGDTISVIADGCELSGFQLQTKSTGVGKGIQCTDADFHRIHSLWINETQGDGINLLRASNCQIHHNHFQGTGASGAGDGIQIDGTSGASDKNVIGNNIFRDVQGDGIEIGAGGSVLDTTIHHNHISGSTGYGVRVGAASVDLVMHNNEFGNNTSGSYIDGGTDSSIENNEQWAKHSIVTEARLAELDGANIPADIAALNDPTVGAIADAVWDEVLTSATHNIANSAGKGLRDIHAPVTHTGTAQGAGTDTNQIQLDVGASATDGAYDPSIVAIVDGTGIGQSRLILEYDGSTKVCTVDRGWKVQPDGTSEFIIIADPGREHVNEGLARAGSTTTITLNTLAASVDDTYVGQTVFLRSGTGEDQARVVTAYNGTTKVATVGAWVTPPDDTTAYAVLATHAGVDVTVVDIWSHVIENSLTVEQLMRGFASALLAKASGMATTTGVFRDLADAKDRITATVDSDGNRSTVTLDLD